MPPIMNYGLLKNVWRRLVTDGLRAEYLKREGYDVQVLEFIDMEHTPKNILLRAVKTGRRADNEESIRACETFPSRDTDTGETMTKKGALNENGKSRVSTQGVLVLVFLVMVVIFGHVTNKKNSNMTMIWGANSPQIAFSYNGYSLNDLPGYKNETDSDRHADSIANRF
ncbi:MAG: hypothetical protein ACLU80_11455 [Dorea sp.]